jgi:hypothetical protein
MSTHKEMCRIPGYDPEFYDGACQEFTYNESWIKNAFHNSIESWDLKDLITHLDKRIALANTKMMEVTPARSIGYWQGKRQEATFLKETVQKIMGLTCVENARQIVVYKG